MKRDCFIVLMLLAGIVIVTAGVMAQVESIRADTGLAPLLDASCVYHDKLALDELNAHTDPDCLAVGACQRLPEKLRKMCVTRVPEATVKCAAGNVHGAHTEIVNARNALEDHVGLLTQYVRANQITFDLFLDNIGAYDHGPWPDPRGFPSQTAARAYYFNAALNLSETQNDIEPRALSILGSLYRLEALPNPCE